MLRAGLIAMAFSFGVVALRMSDVAMAAGPGARWACIGGFSLSLICLLAGFYHAEYGGRIRRSRLSAAPLWSQIFSAGRVETRLLGR